MIEYRILDVQRTLDNHNKNFTEVIISFDKRLDLIEQKLNRIERTLNSIEQKLNNN